MRCLNSEYVDLVATDKMSSENNNPFTNQASVPHAGAKPLI